MSPSQEPQFIPPKSEPQERIFALDVLRGFSLLGILMMNIQAFSMPVAAYFNPIVHGGFSGLDRLAWCATRLFFDVKFLSIFSMLFGASLTLAGGGHQGKRRLGWLLIFGLIHGYFIFVGDILFTYATVGVLVFPARSWHVRKQLMIGSLLLTTAPTTFFILGWAYEALPQSWLTEILRTITDVDAARELAVFQSGYLQQLALRAELSFSNQVIGTAIESGWQAAGCMLIGMAAIQSHFFERAKEHLRSAVAVSCAGLLVTALGMAMVMQSNFSARSWLFAQGLHLIGSIGIAFGWVTGVSALAQTSALQGWVGPIAKLGRVAFSAYILQSLFGLFVFGGQGLGQYGKWSRSVLFAAPFFVWALQLVLAKVWTSRFRVGPLEALWRGLYRGDFSLGRIP